MKFFTLSALTIFLLCSCNEANNSNLELLTDQGPISLVPISGDTFSKTDYKFSNGSLIERFCEESPGYQSAVWLGLNKCDWAIEQHLIEKFKEVVQRKGDSLFIRIPDGGRQAFVHHQDSLEKEKPRFFQFKRFYPETALVQVEEIQEGTCSEHILLSTQNGESNRYPGHLAFSPACNYFLQWAPEGSCTPALQLFEIRDQQAVKRWTCSNALPGIREVKWTNAPAILFALGPNEDPTYYRLPL